MPEPTFACEAWQQHLAGWLVAQLGPAEETALLEHLESCAGCRREAESLWSIAAVSLGADPDGVPWRASVDEEPPADLGDRIVAQVASERRRRRAGRASIAVGAAAAVVVAVLLVRPQDDAPIDGDDVEFARTLPGVHADAVVASEAGGSLVALTARGLDPGVTYALWLTPPGGGYDDRVPAGTFRPDEHGEVDVELHSALPPDEMGRIWATTPEDEIALDTERA